MVVKGNEVCSNFDLNLKVKMARSIGHVFNIDTSFDGNGEVKFGWQARRHCDQDPISCLSDPSFFFDADFRGNIFRSEEPNLVVSPEGIDVAECGDGDITGREICDIGSSSDNSDDIFVHNLDCSDQADWSGDLTCDGCVRIDTSSCSGDSGSCGDDELNPGESCDGDEFFNDMNECNDLKSSLDGDLECINCQYNSNQCDLITETGGGERCTSCSKCDNLFGGDCNQNVCVNACPGPGSCYYDSGIGEDCKSCHTITRCEDYTNELDCEIDRCVLLLDNPCEWTGNTCKENNKCSWNCDNVYSVCVNGVKTKVGSCSLSSGDCNAIVDNPALNYPNEVICLELEEEFPVFTWVNVVLSIVLLIGYYFWRRKN